MFAILRLLALARLKLYRIVLKNGKPVWKDQPPLPPISLDPFENRYLWYQYDYPEIPKNVFNRLVKKGWIVEVGGCWVISEIGKQNCRHSSYRRFVRKPLLSRHRRIKLQNKRLRAVKPKNPEPKPKIVIKRGKVKHDGYRRQCLKQEYRKLLEEQLTVPNGI